MVSYGIETDFSKHYIHNNFVFSETEFSPISGFPNNVSD